jgi:hypothetical protein
VYALNATTGATLWSVALAQAPYNLVAVPKANVDHAASIGSGCGNIDPLGITGTPVIDPALGSAGTLFAVAETWHGRTESTTAPHTWAATPTLQPLGGFLIDDANVGANADGRLELFARGSDGAVWTTYQTSPSGSWATWQTFGGFIPHGLVGAGANADGRMEIYVRGDDGAVWTKYQTARGDWSNWLSFGGIVIGNISVSNNQDGRQQIFFRGSDSAVWTKAQVPSGDLNDYQSLGGTASHDPASGANPSTGKIDDFLVGNDANIWQQYQVTTNGPSTTGHQ